MGWWTDIATRCAQDTPNHGGAATEQRGVVVHIAEGTYEGTINWCLNPDSDVSCHFVVANDGRCTQMLDTDVTAWTQRDGNGKWVSIENEGTSDYYLTPQQVSKNAEIFSRYTHEYSIACQQAYSPDGYGLGYHSMGAENGYDWGHSECPGELIKSQLSNVVAEALMMGQTSPPPEPGTGPVVVSDESIIKIVTSVWTQGLTSSAGEFYTAGELELLIAENNEMLSGITSPMSTSEQAVLNRRILKLLKRILHEVQAGNVKPRPRLRAKIPHSW